MACIMRVALESGKTSLADVLTKLFPASKKNHICGKLIRRFWISSGWKCREDIPYVPESYILIWLFLLSMRDLSCFYGPYDGQNGL